MKNINSKVIAELMKIGEHDGHIRRAAVILERLVGIDYLLRLKSGAVVPDLAHAYGVSTKTIHRDVVALSHIVGPISCKRIGRVYHHRYE